MPLLDQTSIKCFDRLSIHQLLTNLQRGLHEGLPGVREHEVVVRQTVTHRVVGANHVQEGRKQGQGVSTGADVEVLKYTGDFTKWDENLRKKFNIQTLLFF